MNYWMLTISEENFAVTNAQGFCVQGFGQRQRRKTDRMAKGDRLMYYVRGLRVFPAVATIISPAFEDDAPLWTSHQPGERFKYRVRMAADYLLPEHQYLQAMQIAPRLEYVRRWPPEMWPYALMDELHLLPRRDFELLEDAMRKLVGGPAPRPQAPGSYANRGPRGGGRRGGYERGPGGAAPGGPFGGQPVAPATGA